MFQFCQWLEKTYIASAIRQSLWLFPAIETVHLLGMALLVVTVIAFDLRLLGLILRQARVSDLKRALLPWSWAAFAIQVVTGVLLFSSEAVKLFANPAFRLKLLLIVLAGIQVALFHSLGFRNLPVWDCTPSATPKAAKLAGFISLILWVSIATAGRFIGFV
jgi:hypothetical protein